MTPALAVALAAALAVATVLHVLYWRRRLASPTREDQIVQAATADGWTLALGRRTPRASPRRPPVLLVHGIAMNRQAFDFGVERYSMSAFLARSGFDCFALDLRGSGGSRRGGARRWNLDTYLREDVPAALDAIRRATGEEQVLYVGHSLGAILGMAACGVLGERIRALVALAAPARFGSLHGPFRNLAILKVLGVGRVLRLVARTAAPFSGYWHPGPLEVSINLRNVERPIYRRLLANAVEDLQPGVLEQLAVFHREDSFRSLDQGTDYRARLGACRQPALFVSAPKDGLAPPETVEEAFREWGGPKRYFSSGPEYGHTDLLLGRGAPEIVFPQVRDFLLESSERAA